MNHFEFAKNESQLMLEQSVSRYLRKSYEMPERERIIHSAESFGREHWTFFAEMGLLGLPFSEEDGGFAGSLRDLMLVARLFGESLVVEPYFETVMLAGQLLSKSTSQAQKEKWIADVIAGEKLVGLAYLERGRESKPAQPGTRLYSAKGQTLLTGSKYLVAGTSVIETLLVSAIDELGELAICAIPLSTPGVTVRHYKGIDGRQYAYVSLSEVSVSQEDILALDNPVDDFLSVIAMGEAFLCAEALGILESLHRITVEYSQTRTQFGVAIGSFQVLKHRMVDGYTLLYQLQSLVDLVASESPSQWHKHLAATKGLVIERGLDIGHDAIQIHGGMGVTDELIVGHYHKRLVAIRLLLGGGRFAQHPVSQFENAEGEVQRLPVFEGYLDEGMCSFRQEVRDFVSKNLTDEIRGGVLRQINAFTEPEVTGAWLKCLQLPGWQAPHWPQALGGTDWTPRQRFVYDYETGLSNVPELVPMGFRYVGPVISHFGTDWQKSYFLPRILSGEHYWAQGFSEPQAGSDLAAIKTTAVRKGDEFVINGTKIWTTHAHHANWLFCLARTDMEARPQKGIGFFLIELNSPGVRIEPIPLMAGPREVNQVFLDEVRIPATHLVGELTQGWKYTKFLLELERGGAVFCGRARSELNQARELYHRSRPELAQNSIFLNRLSSLETRLMALELLEFKHATAKDGGGFPGVGGSITKLLASELRKDISELAMDISGCGGLEFNNEFLCTGERSNGGPTSCDELVAIPRYLNMRAESIYGGSSEVQREIIAKAVLGLR